MEHGFSPPPRKGWSAGDVAGALAFAFFVSVWVIVYCVACPPIQ